MKRQFMIKEALDNLPSGVCYFDDRGIPLLINKTMYELMYQISGQDIQSLSDFDEVLSLHVYISPDERNIWQFQKKTIGERHPYTEIIASDITELYHKKCELESAPKNSRT